MQIAEFFASLRKSGSRNTMVMSDFSPEVEIRPFHACAMHPPIIIGTIRSLWTWLWGRYHVPQNAFLVEDKQLKNIYKFDCHSLCIPVQAVIRRLKLKVYEPTYGMGGIHYWLTVSVGCTRLFVYCTSVVNVATECDLIASPVMLTICLLSVNIMGSIAERVFELYACRSLE